MSDQMDERPDGWMDGWIHAAWMDGQMDRWMDKWMDGWTEGWVMNGWISQIYPWGAYSPFGVIRFRAIKWSVITQGTLWSSVFDGRMYFCGRKKRKGLVIGKWKGSPWSSPWRTEILFVWNRRHSQKTQGQPLPVSNTFLCLGWNSVLHCFSSSGRC